AEVDMTIEIRGCYNNGTAHLYEEEDFVLYNGIAGNALVTKTAGETLEGTVNFGFGIEIHHLYMTLLRYYAGTDKNKCYQWRYFSPYDGDPVIRFYTEASINVPIEDGKINYKHAYYASSGVSFNMFNIVNEAKYFAEGKITIKDGGYSLLDNLNIEIREIKDGEDITLPIYQTAESLGDSYNEFGISREMTHPFGEWYEWAIGFSDETAEKLSGKKFSWTFPGELSKFNGSGTFPEYMPITKMLSSEGFFPCLELVMEGSKVTAIKYHIAQYPDIEAEYTPEILCYFDGVGIFDHSGNFQGLEEDIWDNFNPAHSGILKLENPVEYDAIDQVHSYFRVYPKVANSKQALDEWIDAGNDHNDNANFIRYGWHCRTDFIDTRAVLIRDDDFNDMSGSIAGVLNAESVNNVTRDELGGASEVTDTVKAQLENDDIEVLGGFNGVEVPDAGNYATKVNVLFNSELLDKLQGVAASDLHVFPLARQNTTASAVRTSGLVRASAASTTKATGQLLGGDGKTLDTVGKKFIVALSLPKSDYYDIYIAKNKSKPQT
ncbi:MAG: hypothetical protein IJR35_05120, partial [Synergistaceae bacterium]|nr:hypothetical protein [Synergistaceae bacterium]